MTRDVLGLLRLLDPEVDPDRVVHLDDPPPPDHPELRAILERARGRRNGQPHPPTPDPGGGPIMADIIRPDDDTLTTPRRARPRLGWLAAAAAAIATVVVLVATLPGGDGTDPASSGAVEPAGPGGEPWMVFTGQFCEGGGATSIAAAPGALIDVHVRNDGSVPIKAALLEVPDADTDLDALAGTYPVIPGGDEPVPGAPLGTKQAITVEAGEESVITFVPPPVGATLLPVCVPFDGSAPTHTGATIAFTD